MGRPAIDLRGRVFGRLRVIMRDGSTVSQRAQWLCFCDPALGGCASVASVSGQLLVRGADPRGRSRGTRSCGCLVTEQAEAARAKARTVRTRVLTPAGRDAILRASNRPRAASGRFRKDDLAVRKLPHPGGRPRKYPGDAAERNRAAVRAYRERQRAA